MTQLEQHRARAIAILLQKADKVVPMLIDYDLDSFLRNLLDLPKRPEGQPPYFGWMVSTPVLAQAPSKISDTGLALIKRWEGCRSAAYQCPAGIWTIGYGHTKTAFPGMKISREQAEELFREDLKVFEAAVTKLVTVPLSQNQFDALVSFTYNVGSSALAKSTLLALLNCKNYLGTAEQFLRWNRAGNVTLTGLVQRRKAEYELFMT
jgi:lysozyme